MTDPTMAGPADNPTEKIPNDQAVTHAWSAAPPVYDYPPTGPQPVIREHAGLKMAGAAMAVLAGAVALAALVPVWREPPWFPPQTQPTATVTATATSILPAPVTETTTETTTMTSPPPKFYGVPPTTADEHYVNLLVSKVGFDRYCLTAISPLHCTGDPAVMIAIGHGQCDYLIAGNTIDAAAAHLRRTYPQWNSTQAFGITEAAESTYCPVPHESSG